MKSKNGFNVLAEKNKLQSSVRSPKNLQEKLMDSSNQTWMVPSPSFKNDNIYSPTKYNINFYLDCQRRSFAMPSGNQMIGQNTLLAFISSGAGKQRHWGQVQRGWSPQIWKSSGGKQGSGGWWQHCTLCWAWRPWLRLSSVLGPWFPGLSEEFVLEDQRPTISEKGGLT